jgi:hypothetical protein
MLLPADVNSKRLTHMREEQDPSCAYAVAMLKHHLSLVTGTHPLLVPSAADGEWLGSPKPLLAEGVTLP